MKINAKNQLEGDNITQWPSTKNTRKFKAGLPDTIVIHYTAGSSAESSARWLAGDQTKASAHLIIGRGGEIFQLVAFDTIASHAGESSYGGRRYLNNYSIGIELDNMGKLKKVGNEYMSDYGHRYQPVDVLEAVHRNHTTPLPWHTYTKIQLEVCRQVCEILIDQYKINAILGHEEIAPTRKTDPGPAFPLDKLRNDLLLQDRTDDERKPLNKDGVVTASSLNIREDAGVANKKIAKALTSGQKVKVLEEKNGWLKVETTITGWVGKPFIEIK